MYHRCKLIVVILVLTTSHAVSIIIHPHEWDCHPVFSREWIANNLIPHGLVDEKEHVADPERIVGDQTCTPKQRADVGQPIAV